MAAHRLRLDPSFRPIVRSSGIVQLGATAESGGILLTGLSAGEIALLDRLDGSLSETELYAAARATGVPHRRAGELLAVLRHHGVLLADQVATSRPGQGGRIATAPRSVDRLVVVGHEPTLSEAVALFVGGGNFSFPTAAVAGIALDIARDCRDMLGGSESEPKA